jgi:hypothetical protein
MTEGNTADALYEKLSPEVRALMEELRGAVREVIPGATEQVHLGYGNILYLAGGNMTTMILALDPSPAYVRDGVDLPDPGHKLEGSGKTLRHVKIRTVEDAHTPELRALMREQATIRGM